MSSIARPGLVSIPVIILEGLALALVLSRNFSGLLHNPTIPVSVSGQLLWISVDGAGRIQYLIQLRATTCSSLKRFSLAVLALVAEFGIDLAILGTVVTSVATPIPPVAPRFPVSVAHLGCVGVAIPALLSSKLVILTGIESSH